MSIKKALISGLTAACCLFSSTAFADCDEMGSDEWNDLNAKMVEAYNDGTNEIALQYGLQLEMICNESPILLYTISDIYRRLNRDQESLTYVRRASENIINYELPQAFIEKIWFRRAELESPMKKQIDDLNNEVSELKASVSTGSSFSDEMVNLHRDGLYKMQWIGTGVAAGGAALAITGGVLWGIGHKAAGDHLTCLRKDVDGNKTECEDLLGHTVKFNKFTPASKTEQVGLGLFIGGTIAAITGATLAIVAHIDIKKFELQSAQGDTVATFTIDANPSGVGMTMNF